MKKNTVLLTAIFAILCLSFKPNHESSAISKNCAPLLRVSKNASGTPKIYRITWYDDNNQNVGKVVNLSSGQSADVGLAIPGKSDIGVKTTGVFSYLSINSSLGTELVRDNYEGRTTDYLFTVSMSCGVTYTINMW
jgi:hypothetical protein